MRLEGEQVLCRFHLTNFVHVHRQPLYELIVEKACKRGMAGATVLRGTMGFILGGPLLAERVWSFSNQIPVIVELVEALEPIQGLLAELAPFFTRGVVTLERAHVLYFSSRPAKSRGKQADSPQLDVPSAGECLTGGESMKQSEEGVLLRIFIGDADVDPATRKPLYEALVLAARERQLCGATVLRGSLGFGKNSVMHAAKLLDISTDMPIVIEIVDSEEKINAFLPYVDAHVTEGLVTLEKLRIFKYVAPPGPDSPPRPTF